MNVYPLIEAEKRGRRNVTRACELLKVSRTAFYAYLSRPSGGTRTTRTWPRRSRPCTRNPRAAAALRGCTLSCAAAGSGMAASGWPAPAGTARCLLPVSLTFRQRSSYRVSHVRPLARGANRGSLRDSHPRTTPNSDAGPRWAGQPLPRPSAASAWPQRSRAEAYRRGMLANWVNGCTTRGRPPASGHARHQRRRPSRGLRYSPHAGRQP